LNWEIIKLVGVYGLIIGILYVSGFLYTRVDILVLGYFDMIVEIGYYEIAYKVVMLMSLPFLVYAQVQAPNMVASYCREGSPAILRKLTSYIKYGAAISLLLAVLFGLTIPWVLRRFLAEYYLPGVIWIQYIFLFLFIFQNISSLVGNTFIISTGHARIYMINIFIFGILNLFLDILLVHYCGYMGIAYAKCMVIILSSLSLTIPYWLVLRRHSVK
jgi:O-antigen/teichoic acid export membrane protein